MTRCRCLPKGFSNASRTLTTCGSRAPQQAGRGAHHRTHVLRMPADRPNLSASSLIWMRMTRATRRTCASRGCALASALHTCACGHVIVGQLHACRARAHSGGTPFKQPQKQGWARCLVGTDKRTRGCSIATLLPPQHAPIISLFSPQLSTHSVMVSKALDHESHPLCDGGYGRQVTVSLA